MSDNLTEKEDPHVSPEPWNNNEAMKLLMGCLLFWLPEIICRDIAWRFLCVKKKLITLAFVFLAKTC